MYNTIKNEGRRRMRFIKKWAYACAKELVRRLGENRKKSRMFYFAFQDILGLIIIFSVSISASLLAGAFPETSVIILFFISLRIFAGGYPVAARCESFFTSAAIFFFAGLIAKYIPGGLSVWNIALFALIAFFAALYIIIRWAPPDILKRPATNPLKVRKMKFLSIMQISVWITLTMVLLIYRFKIYALSGCLGIILAVFFASPAGFRFFDMVKGKPARIFGKKAEKG